MRPIFQAATLATLMLMPVSTQAEETMPMNDHRAILATIDTMTNAFARGDIETVMSTYDRPAAVVASPGGQPITGEADLRTMFAEFIAQGINFSYGAHEVVVSGDTALHLMGWTAPGPDGDMTALSVAVLRRQPDGSWKMVIDHPFGDGVLARQ